MTNTLKAHIFKAALFTLVIIVSANCYGQRSVTFQVATPVTDTVGVWFRFSKNYDLINAGKDFTTTEREDKGKIARRLVHLYLHTPSINSGQYFNLEGGEPEVKPTEESLRFTPRYGGMKDGRIGVRMEDRKTGAFKVLMFEKKNELWRFLPAPKDDLSYYLKTLSYVVHGKLHSARNKRNYVLNKIQEDCLEYQQPFIVPMSCVVANLRKISTKNAEEFKKSMIELDGNSYQ